MGKRLNSYFCNRSFIPFKERSFFHLLLNCLISNTIVTIKSPLILLSLLKHLTCTIRAFGLTVINQSISVPSILTLCLCGDLRADTDSGLGRATPPRRAPSPGMGGSHAVGRHLPSPSGPGSLPPGLITKRRMFDDGSSDISSAQSSMMDYTGKGQTTSGNDRSSRDRLREPLRVESL